MATYLDLQNAIASDLTRSDLGSQIQGAIQDAIKQYERQHFWFNTTRSLTFQTVPGRINYTGADLAQIPNIIRIDRLFLRWGTSTYPLDWYEPDEFEFLTALNVSNGRPTIYTYVDSQIIMWPQPLMAYVIRPHMHYRLAPLVNGGDSNAWTNEAENLIRAQAELILYMNVLEDADGAARMQAQIPGLKAGLDYETSARSATGRIRGTEF
ncbi:MULTISPECIES: hypothetical protein [unclassified Bradyrhizobium]|uniref:phage adaptor protein n=1 Tax=unclassified Bradyrhizobium TaxID=2631580 RepID=UPI002916B513|nr:MULTISPECIES: hypothetical protein [unclassified Bradyrhizobium]